MKTKVFTLILLCIFGREYAEAQTSQFWGTTKGGGTNGDGAIFTIDGNGANYNVEYSFTNPTGSKPRDGLVLANNGKLYGVTEEGGWGDSCVIFSYEPSTGIYTNIYDLYQYTQYGWGAQSKMIKATNGMLYGLCPLGGAYASGVIYQINPLVDSYVDIHNFIYIDGSNPNGSLIQLSNGKLYGMTRSGGTNSVGVIFSFDLMSAAYTKLYDFTPSTGYGPYGDLMQATNSKLYGMTFSGGPSNYGVIFSFDITNGTYTVVHNFDLMHGSNPYGNVIQASNGLLYGMTWQGGSNGDGVLFSFNITTNVFTDLLDFNGANGAYPFRGLTQSSNGKLYGVTLSGGSGGLGVAFSYDIAMNTYTKLLDFSGLGGYYPDCDLVETPILTPTGIPAIVAANSEGVYPNPATSSLTVTGTAKEEEVQFFDVAGKELLSLKISAGNKTHVDITGFPNLFFMKRQNGEVSKIVKE
jgi:uncharacterized repeat protein (TIGR03803 family)